MHDQMTCCFGDQSPWKADSRPPVQKIPAFFVEPKGLYVGVIAALFRDENLDLCQGIRLPTREVARVSVVSRYNTRRYLSCPTHRNEVSSLARTDTNSTYHATLPPQWRKEAPQFITNLLRYMCHWHSFLSSRNLSLLQNAMRRIHLRLL